MRGNKKTVEALSFWEWMFSRFCVWSFVSFKAIFIKPQEKPSINECWIINDWTDKHVLLASTQMIAEIPVSILIIYFTAGL